MLHQALCLDQHSLTIYQAARREVWLSEFTTIRKIPRNLPLRHSPSWSGAVGNCFSDCF
jgi:hypothetical protein